MANPDHIVFLITQLQESTHRFLTDSLRQKGILGIEPSHGIILRQLHLQGSLTMGDLARLTGRTKPTVTVLVRKLVKHGYVEKSRHQEDRRIFVVSLSDKALSLARDLEGISIAMRQRLFDGFKAGEMQVLSDLVEKAMNNFGKK
ncbi:MAG: MarR family transcriptional regulator [Desulfatibacillum sp.]|nr:MarR family transcriptional regulator [Desulfatibacillum sp.]